METTNYCKKCFETKPLSEFYKNKACRIGVENRCKACTIKHSTKYQKENPEATRIKNKKWHQENKERARQNSIKWNEDNREKKLFHAREWTRNNPVKARAIKERWRQDNYDKVYAAARVRKEQPKVRLEEAVRSGVYRSIIRGTKYGRKTFDLLGYSADDLSSHIERQFVSGMSWENYSHDTWHIDHKFPLASFNYTTPDCPDFRKAWALDNLQPMWAAENMSKGARLDHPTQLAA